VLSKPKQTLMISFATTPHGNTFLTACKIYTAVEYLNKRSNINIKKHQVTSPSKSFIY
jgi:hypothetical protein